MGDKVIEAAMGQAPPTEGGGRWDITELAKAQAEVFRPELEWGHLQMQDMLQAMVFSIKARRSCLPLHGDGLIALRSAVREDLEARARMGEQKYGTRLKSHNGRDAELDLLQELYDAWVYSVQLETEGGA